MADLSVIKGRSLRIIPSALPLAYVGSGPWG